jgi:anti-anti-sigma factor
MAPRPDEQLARARATQATAIVVDLSNVSFMDSTGLSVLIMVRAEDLHPDASRAGSTGREEAVLRN